MKSILASLLLFFLCCGFTPVRQIVLPLGGREGVPYFDAQGEGYLVDGFAVDVEEENVYFTAGGKEAVIFCYSLKENRAVYRKPLKVASSGSLRFIDGKLYTLAQWTVFCKHSVIVSQINPATGEVVETKQGKSPVSINSLIFVDDKISLWCIENLPQMEDKFWQGEYVSSIDSYFLFDLSGNKIEAMDNLYHLNPVILTGDQKIEHSQYIGRYQGKPVFYDVSDRHVLFYLVDDNGQVIKQSPALPDSEIGLPFNAASQGNPEDHKLIVGDKMYILAEKDGKAVISVYRMADLFS